MDNQALSYSLMLGSAIPILPRGSAFQETLAPAHNGETLGGFQSLPVKRETFPTQQAIPVEQAYPEAPMFPRGRVALLPGVPTQSEFWNLERLWLVEHGSAYAGQWVALSRDRLLASGDSATEVYRVARSKGVSAPFVVFVDAEEELPFAGW